MQKNKELDDYLKEENPYWTPEELDAIKRVFANFVSDWLNQKRAGFQWKGTTRYRIKVDLLNDLTGSIFLNKYKTVLGLIVLAAGTVALMYATGQLLHLNILRPWSGVS